MGGEGGSYFNKKEFTELFFMSKNDPRYGGVKSESMGAPGRCATCYLSDFNETWPV